MRVDAVVIRLSFYTYRDDEGPGNRRQDVITGVLARWDRSWLLHPATAGDDPDLQRLAEHVVGSPLDFE